MTTLTEVGLKHGTDKATWHGYTNAYEGLLPRRDAEITLLEIGVYRGASIRMWREWFPRAKIVAADIDAETLRGIADMDVERVWVDQAARDALTELGEKYGPFDVIIDDGGHTMEQQQVSLVTLFPMLKPGGVYIVEDLDTSYQTEYGARVDEWSTLDWLSNDLREYPPFARKWENNNLRRAVEYMYVSHITDPPLRCWKCDSPVVSAWCACGEGVRKPNPSIFAALFRAQPVDCPG